MGEECLALEIGAHRECLPSVLCHLQCLAPSFSLSGVPTLGVPCSENTFPSFPLFPSMCRNSAPARGLLWAPPVSWCSASPPGECGIPVFMPIPLPWPWHVVGGAPRPASLGMISEPTKGNYWGDKVGGAEGTGEGQSEGYHRGPSQPFTSQAGRVKAHLASPSCLEHQLGPTAGGGGVRVRQSLRRLTQGI